ncbi:hypothetical protein NECAME_12826 [Necator americanus]|uniref:Uncharacterized protein n=1 Tax=Necator americanus TaxID=51031 RepID=W2SYF7_NECAM|nr:hypothetical protein NECAME_12826 [Necator americanus]ETN74670.1 hypothetical protein NECAME_12826 [Necator americanus]
MVVNSCEYICIDPMPMTGDEPWAQDLFATKEDKAKYKRVLTRRCEASSEKVAQRMLELVNSLVMITFFDIFEYDDLLTPDKTEQRNEREDNSWDLFTIHTSSYHYLIDQNFGEGVQWRSEREVPVVGDLDTLRAKKNLLW